jgi:uncharacterized membrane protein (DUF4010 family)
MVVLISAIGFGNYLLLRRYGARGIVYTGFLGGLVNSTATVAELTRTMGAEDASSTDDVFTGIMLAKVAMYLRNGVLLAVFAPGALRVGLLPIGLMIAPSVGLAARGLRRLSIGTPDVRLRSPFSLRSALEFGVYFLVLTVAAGTAQRGMGTPGFYAVAVLGGAVLASLGSALALVPPIARATREKGLLRRVAIAVAGVTGMGLLGLGLNRSILG